MPNETLIGIMRTRCSRFEDDLVVVFGFHMHFANRFTWRPLAGRLA